MARNASKGSRTNDLAAAVAGIERKFGVGALQRLGDVPDCAVEALPTDIKQLDRIIGIGGRPRGRICEVFGPESVGVSTLLLQSTAAAQQRGGIVAYVDVDHAFIPEYARRLGCHVEQIFIAKPDDGPMALEIVDALVRCSAFNIIVLDSVPGLYAKADNAAGEHDESVTRARLLSEAMRGLAANIDRTRTFVLFGNRLAQSGADVAEPEVATPGGRALRFYSSVRLAMQRGRPLAGRLGAAGLSVKATTVKNKIAPPLRTTEITLWFGHGFTEMTELPPSGRPVV
jgi:recombination protein RecA